MTRATGLAGVRQIATRPERLVDQRDQLGLVERLHHVVVGAEFHGLDGGLRRAERGHQDDHRLRLRTAQHLQRLDAGHAAHAVIEEDDVGLLPFGEGDADFPAVGFKDLVALAGQRPTQGVAQVLVVIDDEDFGGRGGGREAHGE